jgi:RNA polymerase sigma factor (sigma-70 family)
VPAPIVLTGTPHEIVAILRSAQGATPHPRLDEVLADFRRHWFALARKRYPSLADDVEDAIQTALMKLVSPEKLDSLKDPARLSAWARSLFINTVLDIARDGRRHVRGRAYLGQPDDDPEQALREQLPSDRPTPEETLAYRERLAIVSKCVDRLEVARLKFVEDLPEKEIAARQNLTRDGVAGQLKRIRKGLRDAFGDDSE